MMKVILQTKISNAISHQVGVMVDVAMIAALLDAPGHTGVAGTMIMIPMMTDRERGIEDVRLSSLAIIITVLTRSRGPS